MIHRIYQEQILATDIKTAWEFFSTPKNLGEITPSDIGFEIEHITGGAAHEGQIITYKIQVLPFLKLDWVTEITKVREGKGFIDDQRVGPYALWHHRHEFEEVDEGVKMIDEVTYALPFGIFGDIAHALFVRNKLESIFGYRRQKVAELFPGEEQAEGLAQFAQTG